MVFLGPRQLPRKDGAESRTRTDDLLITNQLLYQLSYFGLLFDCIVTLGEGKAGPPSIRELNGRIQCLSRKAMTVLAQTLQLAIRIAIVWAGGFVFAVSIRAALPEKLGYNITMRQGTLFVPFDRVGFWTCVLAALIVTCMVVFRAMVADLGFKP